MLGSLVRDLLASWLGPSCAAHKYGLDWYSWAGNVHGIGLAILDFESSNHMVLREIRITMVFGYVASLRGSEGSEHLILVPRVLTLVFCREFRYIYETSAR